jgi:hypothetical protein
MIAAIKTQESNTAPPAWHVEFLAMVPAIRRQAQIAFRKAHPELRHDLIGEVVANCYVAYARLVELDKMDQAYPTVLARFAIAQVRAGRRVGNRLCVRDVMSNYAQFRKGFQVERLDHFDEQDGEWQEILVEDGRAGPAEIAASRIDFAAWLRQLPARLRKVAETLATGETTIEAAQRFGISQGRISQFRLWLRENWLAFQGEVGTEKQPRLAVA